MLVQVSNTRLVFLVVFLSFSFLFDNCKTMICQDRLGTNVKENSEAAAFRTQGGGDCGPYPGVSEHCYGGLGDTVRKTHVSFALRFYNATNDRFTKTGSGQT